MQESDLLHYALAGAVGFGASLVLLALLYCLWARCRSGKTSSSGRSTIFTRLRRTSLYLSNTSPLAITVPEVLFNLAGAPTDQPHHHPMTGHTDVPPRGHLWPPPNRSPLPPSPSHQQIPPHLVGTVTPRPSRPVPGTHQDTTRNKKHNQKTNSLCVNQMGTGRQDKVNMSHFSLDRKFESKVHSNGVQTEPRPRQQNKYQPTHSSRPLPLPPLPEPPAQSPKVIVSLYRSTPSLPHQPQSPFPSPTPSWRQGKFLEHPRGSTTRHASRLT